MNPWTGASELGSESEISTPGAFAGTPAFASPEQFAGLGADIRSDLYSLGVTLWEMLAGQVPFRGSPSELMLEHQQAPLPREQVKSLPQPVLVLLDVLLAKDPSQRFQNPAQLAAGGGKSQRGDCFRVRFDGGRAEVGGRTSCRKIAKSKAACSLGAGCGPMPSWRTNRLVFLFWPRRILV